MPIYKGSTNQGLIYYGSPNTNCLTSVPKNITLTYNAGVFTVHAGSIITVPYGGGTTLNVGDKIGTVLEVVKVVGSYIQLKLLTDYSDTFGGDTSTLYMLTLGFNTNGNMYWSGTTVSANTSGSTDSSASVSDDALYFNTTSNIIYRRYGGGTTGYQFGGGINGVWISLPIACHYGTPTKAEQIFDWCGFIGSTAFVLPGVKGLIPNGFNADGTYKSIEFTTDTVLTATRTWDISASFIQKLFLYNRGKGLGIQNYQTESNSMPTVNDWTVWYNPKENIQRWNNSSNTLTDISQWTVDTTMRYIGEIPSDGTSKITSLTTVEVQPLQSGIPITKVYKGSTLVYRFDIDPFSLLFTNSGTFEVPQHCKKLTVVLVGGGASSGHNSYHRPNIFETFHITGGAGGSGAKVILEFTRQNMPSSFDFTVGQATTGLLQNGGDTSVTIGGTTYTAGGGVKPYQCGGGDGDTTNFGGAGGSPNVEVGGVVVFAQKGTTGQSGEYRGGSTARTTGWEVEGTVYGSGGGQYGNSDAYGAYEQGDGGCVFITAE